METTSITKFTYRIEPNPAGGFIARPTDSSLEPIEGATREEIQQKIQAKITDMVQSQLPVELKLGGLNVKINRNVTITTGNTSASNTNSSQPTAQNLLSQNGLGLADGSSDTVSRILRIAAGALALLAILYFLLHR